MGTALIQVSAQAGRADGEAVSRGTRRSMRVLEWNEASLYMDCAFADAADPNTSQSCRQRADLIDRVGLQSEAERSVRYSRAGHTQGGPCAESP